MPREISVCRPASSKLAVNRLRRLHLEALEDRQLLTASNTVSMAAAVSDDSYEQNDTFGAAKNLGTITSSQSLNNLVMADVSDWYRFTLSKAAASTGSVSIAFTHAQGDLDLELYNSAGSRLRVAQGIANSELISLGGLAAGTYYVRAYGYRGVANPNYSLAINPVGTAAQLPTDDNYENNDTQAVASNLGTLTANASISNLALNDTADWFRFTTSATGTAANSVAISFQNAQGNLALQLVSASGTVLATANGIGDSENISLANRAAGTYYVRVYSATGATNANYSLQIITPRPTSTPTTGGGSDGNFDIQIDYAGFTATQRAIFEQAAARWEAVIVGDLPSATYNGVIIDDLLINASSTAIDGVGGTLGQAGYDRARTTGSRLPYHGSMEFDSADLASMEADGSLLSVIVHEMGHVLGVGTLWQSKGLLVGAGTSNPIFVGQQATAAYNAIFGTSVSGVPVENGGGSGTRDAHWRETTFNNEIMTGYINSGSNPLSRITVASLADIGYTVNIAAADPYARPGSGSLVAAASTTSSSVPRLAAADDSSAAISGSSQRSTSQARNLAPQLVLAWLDERWRVSRVSAAANLPQAAAPPTSPWSSAVELFFAGETDLCRDEEG